MAINLSELATCLQTLFTTDAHEAARAAHFVRRRRKLDGATFVQTLVFGWLDNPRASLEDLADLAAQLGHPVTASAVDQRLGPAAAGCLQDVLAQALHYTFAADPAALPFLRRFSGISVLDSTTIALPAALAEVWPGCGGSTPNAGRAALKVQLRVELLTGLLEGLSLHAGRTCEVGTTMAEAPLPEGSLRLADLGYYSLPALQAYDQQQVYWLSRLPARTALFDASGRRWKLHSFLAAQTEGRVDQRVAVGSKHRLGCRLVAWRVPDAVVAKRRQRLQAKAAKSGRPISTAQWQLCAWTVYITNVPASLLSVEEACVLGRCRWQIELLFKLWKSEGKLAQSRGERGWRVLCEVLAKLIGMVVQHWARLTGGESLVRQSGVRAAKGVRAVAVVLVLSLGQHTLLVAVLQGLRERLNRERGKQKRRGQPAAFQLLSDPNKLEFQLEPAPLT